MHHEWELVKLLENGDGVMGRRCPDVHPGCCTLNQLQFMGQDQREVMELDIRTRTKAK